MRKRTRVNAKWLREKFAEDWAKMETLVWDEYLAGMKRKKQKRTLELDNVAQVVAYNTAFIHCCAVYSFKKEMEDAQNKIEKANRLLVERQGKPAHAKRKGKAEKRTT